MKALFMLNLNNQSVLILTLVCYVVSGWEEVDIRVLGTYSYG